MKQLTKNIIIGAAVVGTIAGAVAAYNHYYAFNLADFTADYGKYVDSTLCRESSTYSACSDWLAAHDLSKYPPQLYEQYTTGKMLPLLNNSCGEGMGESTISFMDMLESKYLHKDFITGALAVTAAESVISQRYMQNCTTIAEICKTAKCK